MKAGKRGLTFLLALLLAIPGVMAAECDHAYVTMEVPATCTESGYTYDECTKCGDTVNYQSLPLLGHDFQGWTVLTEAGCTQTGLEVNPCSRCDHQDQRELPATGHSYVSKVVEPTCEKDGYTEKTCSVCGDSEKTEIVPATGHSYVSKVVEPTCEKDGYTEKTCSVCGDSEKTEIVPALGHSYVSKVVEPTCEKDGYTEKTCSVCGDSEKTEIVPALGHSYVSKVVEPTCEKDGYTEKTCSVCGASEKTEIVPALGHSYVSKVVEPTCEKDGYTEKTCSVCGDSEKTDIVPAVGHSYFDQVVEPTCEQEGYTEHICSACGHSEKTDFIEALGHDDLVTVVEPTCTKDGYTQRQCRRCLKTEKSDPVPALGHSYDDGVVIRQPSETASGQVKYTCVRCTDSYTETLPRLSNPFLDVPKEEYFYGPVLWAVEQDITKGVDESHFEPHAFCTRAQVVTFLWRYMGQPEPESLASPFGDLAPGEYYYKAVLWAVEQGITNGIEAGRFGPMEPCTRVQVVTFLYRAFGQPEVTARELFADVDPAEYYYRAVLWAVDREITNGMEPDRFAPHEVCTRAHTVTFLYRADGI